MSQYIKESAVIKKPISFILIMAVLISMFSLNADAAVMEYGTTYSGVTYYHNLSLRPYLKTQLNKVEKGIDVSSYNSGGSTAPIDWEAVASDSEGIDYAYIRLGDTQYLTKDLTCETDSSFSENAQNGILKSTAALEADGGTAADGIGMDFGIYYFSQATSTDEAIAEANFVISTLQSEGITSEKLALPVMMDVEYISKEGQECRLKQKGLSSADQTDICNAFISTIRAAGYKAGVYANKSFLENHVDIQSLVSDAVWLANYTTKSSYASGYDYWQCTDKGTVDGISGNVDLDFRYLASDSGTSGDQLGINGTTALTKKSATASHISLSWKAVSGSSGYVVYRSSSWNGTYNRIKFTSGTSFTDTGLSSGTEYYYKVCPYLKSDDQIYIGTASSVLAAYTTGLQDKRAVLQKLNLRNMPGTVGTKVKSALPAGAVFSVKAKTADSSGTSWYRVSYGSLSGYVIAGSAYSKPYASKVSGLKKTSVTKKTVRLKWSKASYADGYVVYRATSKSGSYKAIKTYRSSSTVTYSNTGLKHAKKYYYKIRAFRKENNNTYYGAYSSVLSVKTK